jgi:polar amino acid transport system substrate-binding protein
MPVGETDCVGWEVELMNASLRLASSASSPYAVAKFDSIEASPGQVRRGISSFTDNIYPEGRRLRQLLHRERDPVGFRLAGKTVDPDNACGLKVAVQATTYQDTDEVPVSPGHATDAGKGSHPGREFDTRIKRRTPWHSARPDDERRFALALYAIARLRGQAEAFAGKSFEVRQLAVSRREQTRQGRSGGAAVHHR